jgi:ribosomal protein L11 methyltransferase
MNHTEVSIEATAEQQEILIALLADVEAIGFEQTETNLIAYFDENNFPSYDVSTALEGFTFYTTTITEKNWNEEWESNFDPVIVDDFCAVRAHFHQPITGVKHEILITPKMSFGTGHHATTYMMMQQMRELNFAGKSVFDFGTGTGILAVLAEKLGAASVIATDNDEWSITNGKENVENNACQKVELQLTETIPSGTFDMILANINRNVILQYLPQLKSSLVQNGSLLLSGLMVADQNIIVEACQDQSLNLVKHLDKSGWISLLFVNTP